MKKNFKRFFSAIILLLGISTIASCDTKIDTVTTSSDNGVSSTTITSEDDGVTTTTTISTSSDGESTTTTTEVTTSDDSEGSEGSTETETDTTYSDLEITTISQNEGFTATFNDSDVANVKVYFRLTGETNYTEIDSNLIRQQDSNTVRVDAVGLPAGSYDIKILSSNDNTYVQKDIPVYSYDRSGYAHFNYTKGVGAYNDDGSLKDEAIVVYVTDDTKNSVTATINGEERTGLVEILKAAQGTNEAVDIRLIGSINTTQWNNIEYGTGNSSARVSAIEEAFSYDTTESSWDTTTSTSAARLYEDEIISLGINSMSNDLSKGITELDGLTNYVSRKYSSTTISGTTTHEYDSYYNMLDILDGNNITIEGIGSDASINQLGFTFKRCNSIEIRNITFNDYTEDAVGFEGNNDTDIDYGNYWLHNCTFNEGLNNWDVCPENDKADGDGSSDIKRCHNVTIDYVRYNGCHKTNLIGSGDSIHQYNITLHHNYYYKCSQRMPLVRQANIHMYNNYYYGSTSYSCSVRANAFAFIEGCYFERGLNPYEVKTSTTYTSTAVKSYNNVFSNVTRKSGYKSGNNVSSRTTTVSGNCTPTLDDTDYTNFDTNSSLFYYDSVNKVSDVEHLTNAQTAKAECKIYSGVARDEITIITYTVSFVLNGGSCDYLGNTTSIIVIAGDTLTELPTPTYTDKTFIGWYLDEELSEVFDTSSEINEDITLYAKYADTVTITYVTNGGDDLDPTEVVYGETASLSTPTRTGYNFLGWYTDEALTELFDSSSALTEDITLYASWEESSGDVTYTFDSVSSGSYSSDVETSSYTIHATSAKTVSVSSTSASYGSLSFSSCVQTGGAGTDTYRSIEFTITETKTLTVYYCTGKAGSERQVAVLGIGLYVDTNGNIQSGIITLGTGELSSSTSTLSAYSITLSAGTYYITSAGSGLNIYGYTLSPSSTEIYTVTYQVSDETYTMNVVAGQTAVELTGLVKEGYIFNGFTKDNESYDFSTEVTSDITLVASFKELTTYTLTLHILDETTTISTYEGTTFSEPDAPVIDGYTFLGWYSDETYSTLYSFDTVASADIDVYAYLIEKTVTSISLDTSSLNTTFNVGDTFDASSLVVIATYSDDSQEEIDLSILTIDSSAFDSTTVGTYEIVVYYSEDIYASFEVSVIYSLESISISTVVLDTIVVDSEEINTDSTVVIGTTSSGEKVNVVDYVTFIIGEENSEGVTEVVVTYNYDSTISDSYTVTRIEKLDSTNPVVNVDSSYEGVAGEYVDNVRTFKTLNEAVDYINTSSLDQSMTINLLAGTYYEKVTITASNVRLIGAGYSSTIISNGFASGTTTPDLSGTWGTSGSATVTIAESATNFYAEGVYFYNSFDYINSSISNKQAVALYVMSDQAVFEKCAFFGYQDTLETRSGRQLFNECLIQGSVDYIFGYNSTSVFTNCEIKTIYRGSQGGYITASQGCLGTAGTDTIDYGFIYIGCTLTADSKVKSSTISLARPWRQDSQVAYISCYMGSHIRTTGNESSGRYVSMSGNTAAAARFYEYANFGPGAIASAVTGCTMLSEEEANSYLDFSTIYGTTNGLVSYDNVWNGTNKVITSEGSSYVTVYETCQTSSTSLVASTLYSSLGLSSTLCLTEATVYGNFTFSKGVRIKSDSFSNNKTQSVYSSDYNSDEANCFIAFDVDDDCTGYLTVNISSSGRYVYVYQIVDGVLTLVKSSTSSFTISELSSSSYIIMWNADGESSGVEPKISSLIFGQL